MWKHFSWLAFYFLEQTNKNCLFMLYSCLCRWDVRMHSAFKWGCNAFCRDPKTAMRDTAHLHQCLFRTPTTMLLLSKQAASRLPPELHHVNKGVGSSLCEELSWPITCAAHTGIHKNVWAGELNSAFYFFYFFLAKLCQGGAWLVMRRHQEQAGCTGAEVSSD